MEKIDVIIFGGQSNMQGESDAVLPDGDMSNSFEYKMFGDRIVPLATPVGENVRFDGSEGEAITDNTDLGEWLSAHALGSACYGNTNLVPAFCEIYTQKAKRKALAVHCAKGSTMISDWLPGTAAFDLLIKKASSAIRRAKKDFEVERVYFVWLQGESDAIFAPDRAAYKEKLARLASALESTLSIDKFGVIRVGRFTRDERDDEIIAAQDEICREDDRFLMLTEIATELNEIPEYMNPSVEGHYSAKGLQKLGHEAGQALAAYKTAEK